MAYGGLGSYANLTGGSTQTTSDSSPIDDMLIKWEKAQESARLTNMKREDQIGSIYDEIIRRYEPGGEFGKAALSQLDQQKIRDVGGETQQMISSGLYGTTTAANIGSKWEATVGQPARLRLEDLQMQRLSEAQQGKASFMERIDTPYPDYAALMQSMKDAAQSSGGGSGSSGGLTVSGSAGSTQKWGSYGAPSRSGSTGSSGSGAGGSSSSPYSGGGASAGVTYGPEGGGLAHQATPGYGLGGKKNPYSDRGYSFRPGGRHFGE